MNNQQKPSFSIKCQCSAFKKGMCITSKKKSKLSNLSLSMLQRSLTIIPLNSKEQSIVFCLKRLKHIHVKCIREGKITLEFAQEDDQKKEKHELTRGSQFNDAKVERLDQIYVEAASPQNLHLMVQKIMELKKTIKLQSKALNKRNTTIQKDYINTEDQARSRQKTSLQTKTKKKQNFPKPERFIQRVSEKRIDPLGYSERHKQYEKQQKNDPKITRKQLMRQIHEPQSKENISHQRLTQAPYRIFKPQVDILQLPSILLQKILQYTQLSLLHRLINKKFDTFVLRRIKNLKLKDQIDEETFNKLAKFAVNIRGRLKNVRSVTLMDVYDEKQLEKDKAKGLCFGQWKQMSRKNIDQIKGLRIHTLEMPYQIKFQFQHIYGIKLRELHLYSRSQVTTPNSNISDQSILYLFKHVVQLESFSIPYINSSVLHQLTTTLRNKACSLLKLKFGSVNQNLSKKVAQQQSWFLFHGYEQLRSLSVERVLRGGLTKRDVRYNATFPQYIQQLQLGSFVSQQVIKTLPMTLKKLKLIGEMFLNLNIEQIYLPYLRVLDLTQCTLVRPSVMVGLQQCSNLKMITNWQKQDIEYYNETALEKGIELHSIRGMIVKR